jgi:DNA-directed RNA polymerase sigma subunit (sigma70/sigma32)
VQTLRGLGADLGISAERVCQLEQQALETLHAAAPQAPTSS